MRRACDLGWWDDDWSDFELRLVLRGKPAVLKNSKRVYAVAYKFAKPSHRARCPKCRTPLVPVLNVLLADAAKKAWDLYLPQAISQWGRSGVGAPIPKKVMVNAKIVTHRATHHRADSSNLYQLPEDVLQAAGVLVDDYQIESHDGSRRDYDKDNPRVEVTLTPAKERHD